MDQEPESFTVAFDGGGAAAVRLPESPPSAAADRLRLLATALGAIGLRGPRRALVVVGGAGGLTDADLERLRPLFADALAREVTDAGAVVFDGATDSGVMRLMGEARRQTGGGFPLVGVAADGTVTLPGGAPPAPDAAPLEPHHSHFVLVRGKEWGDESPWIAQAATALAAGAPSVTVLVNGGDVAYEDVAHSLAEGRPVLVAAGTGRTADALAAAVRARARGEETEAIDERARRLAATGRLQVVETPGDAAALARSVRAALGGAV